MRPLPSRLAAELPLGGQLLDAPPSEPGEILLHLDKEAEADALEALVVLQIGFQHAYPEGNDSLKAVEAALPLAVTVHQAQVARPERDVRPDDHLVVRRNLIGG